MSGVMLGPLCAFLSSFTWAIGSAGYSRLSRKYSPFSVNFSRAIVALPLFILATLLTHASYLHVGGVRIGWLGLSMFASYGFGDSIFLLSTRSLGVPGALAIASSYPILTAIGGAVFLGEAVSLPRVAGLLITVAGVVTVILNTPSATEVPSGSGGSANSEGEASGSKEVRKGVLLALCASVLWALNSLASSRGGAGISPAVGNSIRMIWALLISSIFGRYLFPDSRILLPKDEMGRSLWLFLLEAFVGSYFFLYGLSHSPLAVGSTLASLAPAISVPVAWALKLEKFSFFRTLGVCAVVVGVWLLV